MDLYQIFMDNDWTNQRVYNLRDKERGSHSED